MKIKDMLGTIISSVQSQGTFTTPDLIRQAKAGSVTGIAATKDSEREMYLAFISGETEGAIIIDEKGELFGDKVVVRITGKEQFTLYPVDKEIVEAVVMGCRVFDKSHLRTTSSYEIPEFGKKSSGIGHLTLIVQAGDAPQAGIRVSIRKDGKIVGADTTANDGSVGFRVMHGNYDIILQGKDQMITTRRIMFDDANPRIILKM